jgi:hypothetical protein
MLLTGSCLTILGIAGLTVHLLRKAAADAEATRQVLKAESDCVGQIQHAIQLVAQRDGEKGIVNRVIDSKDHYNHQLRQCYVDIETYEHRDSAVFVKTLISPDENTAVLWSVTGRVEDPGRQCFGPDSMPLDCIEVDKRWKTYMTQ